MLLPEEPSEPRGPPDVKDVDGFRGFVASPDRPTSTRNPASFQELELK
jgi:hypothetical protein